MNEYISKENIQKICMEERSDFGNSVVDRIWRRIKTFPSADVIPISELEQIINNTSLIQEDVFRYKMICELIERYKMSRGVKLTTGRKEN